MEFSPYLVAWNLTKRCNLKCSHCYLDASELEDGGTDELTKEDGISLIEQISKVNPNTILVITGGEPLLRGDILDIGASAVKKLMMVVLGTNGILIDKPLASELVRIGITGTGISLDSLDSKRHDAFRGLPGAWESTMKGIEACKEAGLEFQIHTTVNKDNLDEIDSIIEYSHKAGARVFNLFFLVCTGRGEKFTDISPPQYESTLRRMVDMQGRYEGMLIRARCAPYFKRIAYQKDPLSPLTKAAGYMGGGCLAGTFYCRIAPNGDVTPCPYMTVSAGNIKKESFSSIWANSSILKSLRNPDLGGKCGECEYRLLCGGCRARPYSATGDFLGEDSWCLYKPKGGRPVGIDSAASKPNADLVWDGKARERLARIPYFLRGMVEKGVERYAREKGTNLVTPELMEELRKKRFGTEKPIFKM